MASINRLNVERQIRNLRRQYRLSADSASDQIWVRRIAAGTATVRDVERRLAEKATREGVNPYNPATRAPVSGGRTTGGGGGAPAAPAAPKTDYRAIAQGEFPWLTGQLLDLFAGFWDETGDSSAALGKLRQTAEHARVFDGIRREDGTMRMGEGEYFADKAGFAEVLREFGLNPASYDKRYADLIRKDVRAPEFANAAAAGFRRFVEPGGNDTGLFNAYVDAFISTGAEEVALRTVRNSDAYDKTFVGNRREDGTLRMDEPEFFAYKRGWQTTLAGFGLNPQEFEARGRFEASVRGELSIQEVGGRLQAVQDGILDRADQIKEFYANGYGLELTNESILGMAIDPSVQRDVLERRVTAGQIGGEAARQGFMRTVQRAETLARAGLTGDAARGLYAQAGMQLPGLSATTRRFHRGDTTLDEFEDVIGLGDAAGQGRLQSALREETVSFDRRDDVRRSQDGFGLSGLTQR